MRSCCSTAASSRTKRGDRSWPSSHIPSDELAKIASPTLLISGDDDMISLEHTVSLYRAIPGAELAVVPGTSHCLAEEKPAIVNRLIVDFLENEPIQEMMPIRRVPAGAHP